MCGYDAFLVVVSSNGNALCRDKSVMKFGDNESAVIRKSSLSLLVEDFCTSSWTVSIRMSGRCYWAYFCA